MTQIQRNIGGYIGNLPSKTKIGSYVGNGPSKANIGVFTPNQQFNLARRGVWNPPVPVPALSFDGTSGSYMQTSSTVLAAGNTVTIEAWVYIKGKGDNSWNRFVELSELGFNWDNDGLQYGFFYPGGTLFVTGSDPQLNTWLHWAGVIDNGAGKIYFYQHGTLKKSVNTTVSFTDHILLLAAKENLNEDWCDANLSDVRIWNVARTQTEIKNNMYERLTGTETGLVAYYKLDEATGTTATDSAGSSDGTINGATWVQETDLKLYE